jgi:hypothetical protein
MARRTDLPCFFENRPLDGDGEHNILNFIQKNKNLK